MPKESTRRPSWLPGWWSWHAAAKCGLTFELSGIRLVTTDKTSTTDAGGSPLERGVRPLTPLHARIVDLLTTHNGIIGYHGLMAKLWPADQYPRAYRNSSNGGPPGVAMVLGRALGQMSRAGLVFDDIRVRGRRKVRLLRAPTRTTNRDAEERPNVRVNLETTE